MKMPLLTHRPFTKPWRIGIVFTAAIFGGLGVFLLTHSSALTPTASFETENGTLTGAAAKLSVADASAGSAVQFGSTTQGTAPSIPNPARPTVETVSYPGYSGDISDDSAIWANPTDPSKSVVIADNKDTNGGIGVFDMQGQLKQFRQEGMFGNVDLRSGMLLGGKSTIVVGANNRTNNSLQFWALDPATQTLSAPISARTISTSTGSPNYGFCMYTSATTGKHYAFVTPNGAGSVQQYELWDNAGKVDATLVRTLSVPSITESCVVDDTLGNLYVGVEDVALYKYGAEPSAGTTRTTVDSVGAGRLVADIEGMAIAYGPNSTGYLVVSSQGNSTYAIYDRQTNAPLRTFSVGSNGGIDGASNTDGLDITTANLGPGFEYGALVVHDEINDGGATSNLKYIPLVP